MSATAIARARRTAPAGLVTGAEWTSAQVRDLLRPRLKANPAIAARLSGRPAGTGTAPACGASFGLTTRSWGLFCALSCGVLVSAITHTPNNVGFRSSQIMCTRCVDLKRRDLRGLHGKRLT